MEKDECRGVNAYNTTRGPRNQLEDQGEWEGKRGTEYSVSDAYCKILGEGAGDEEEVFQILWKAKVTPAVQICAQRLVLNRLPT